MEQQMKIIADAVNEIVRQTLADRDEIERLLKKVEVSEADRIDSCCWWSDLADDMNDDIERLREALQDIADFPLHGDYSNAYEMPTIAARALAGKIEEVK
jgi:septation ring formation regulator EzrA